MLPARAQISPRMHWGNRRRVRRCTSGRSHLNYLRDYDPATGRYVESDPIGIFAGVNTYTYVEGGPLAWTDPLGLCDEKKCVGKARVLKGNRRFLRKRAQGAFPGHRYNKMSAAVITEQFGLDKAGMTPYLNQISGYINGVEVFNNIADRIDNSVSPIPGESAAQALEDLYPGLFILELPGAKRDMGVQSIELHIPAGLACPTGTVAVK